MFGMSGNAPESEPLRKRLSRWLDSLLPESALQRSDCSFETKIRARVLISLLLSNIGLSISLLLVFILMTLFSSKNFTVGIIITALVLTVWLLQMWLFRSSGNVSISAMMLSMTFFTICLVSVIATGGWISPIKSLFLCVPAISFLVGGYREGIYMAGLILFSGLSLMLASMFDFQLFQVLPPENILFISVLIWLVSMILLVSCLLVYDFLLEDLARRLKR